ncbi:MAG: ThiF family adenylyltransferase [Bdellovibrionales bacterium]|nr:ThiF family adenylyltransferase [Bdellovibrionales bacterium]
MKSARFQRNLGYITEEQQAQLARRRILVAGCGVGSFAAEALLRLGFGSVRLVDGDTVAEHNLNRQDYVTADVGTPKASALGRRLQTIFPDASIEAVPRHFGADNALDLLQGVDVVVDTIDFLALDSIVRLHDSCNKAGIPVISAMAVGWGSMAMVAPPRSGRGCWFRELFGIAPDEVVENESYKKRFIPLFERMSPHLDPAVIRAMLRVFDVMEDGKPCPAPALSAGTFSVASLVATLAFRVAAGLPVTEAPDAILIDLLGMGRGISLL